MKSHKGTESKKGQTTHDGAGTTVAAVATSPAASGPAGSLFEGQVGASFLLALLVGAEPRGLPGTTIDRVGFQRAAEGHALDDVIVHAHDAQGESAVLEVQVKRGLTFAPRDTIFKSVVSQIAEVSCKPDFWKKRHELAIAISRTSHKIDGPYQDVLTWARQLGDAVTFMERIDRSGSASDDMRAFVNTFTSHLRDVGVPHDNETVWGILRRVQIFVFDFTAVGSASEDLAKERAVRSLHPDDTPRAGELWSALSELAIEVAAAGGDRTRDLLKENLRQKTFRLAGDRRSFTSRAALAEASRNVLADIGDHVGGAMLTRHERVAAVHAAMDTGRYLEIRGDAGVGKSGILKHFAEQISCGAQVMALSPKRTIPKGWVTMKSVLDFDGTARELLSDLAASGSGILFLDNLDFYDDEERLTVIDLLRETASVSGMSVIATARRDFGVVEPSWIPADVIDRLGRAEPVVIDELSDAETEELRNAAPQLRGLLADNHPARQVARNLFRLSRLASLPLGAPVLRTEVDMATQWWNAADGVRDQNHRERARLLRALGEQSIAGADRLEAGEFPAVAVDALVASETLRDLGNDGVTFRHDVLREWAIANLLFSDPGLVQSVPLDRPAPTRLARGVELAARMAIERAPDSQQWQSFLDSVSMNEHHGSWRRSAMLALVRSEIGEELLDRASLILLEGKAQLLRELIRLVMAVDVEPSLKRFAALGFDPKVLPANLNVPNGPSWGRLILWIMKQGVSLPPAVIPDVVDLYNTWMIGSLGHDPLTPLMVHWLHRWLTEIEEANELFSLHDMRRPFNGDLTYEQVGPLEEALRMGFLGFCHRTPELAKKYLESLRKRRYGEQVKSGILKSSGALPTAAPKELAEFTAELLIPNEEEERRDRSYTPFRDAFGHHDTDFVPASPSQGPFLNLLVHAPEHGLTLIRQLVDHAISFKSGGRNFGKNAITITYLDGSERVFPWIQSYNWSRDVGVAPSIVTSALMALEAWGHRRIEAGEPVDKVLVDILGPANSSTSYLLVAVDLLLSHWPKSRIGAIPFLACPDLLCLDRSRVVHDNMEFPDFFGLKGLQKEPIGLATVDSLKARASRRFMLDQFLASYALDGSVEDRTALSELLRRAASRLGPPNDQSNFKDPEFMVLHALNTVDPKNWRKKTSQSPDGSTEEWEYIPPEAEGKRLESLEAELRERHTNDAIERSIEVAFNNPGRSSAKFAAAAIAWAQKLPATSQDAVTEDDYEAEFRKRMQEERIVSAAVIAARDGGTELIAANETWIRDTFLQNLRGKSDPVHRVRDGLKFNPIAIAFAGMVLLLKNRIAIGDVRIILESAGDDNPAAAHGFAAAAGLLVEIDERLPRSVLRCSFAARMQSRRNWRQPEDEHNARVEAHRKNVAAAIEAELAWLEGKREEPEWPVFPANPARPRHRFVSARERKIQTVEEQLEPVAYVDYQGAALWLASAASLCDVAKRPWLRDIVKSYTSWTMVTNGAELEEDDDAESRPREWNDAFFKLLAKCLPGLTSAQIDKVALKPVSALPDESFLDITSVFLREVDGAYFNDCTLHDSELLHVRSALAQRLMKTRGWERHVRDRSKRIEIHLGPAVAVVLFNDYGHFQPAKCYLKPKGVERLTPFLPLLEEVAGKGTFLLVAISLLNLIETAPSAGHLPLIVGAGLSWATTISDDKEFWVDHGVGRRLCALIEAILTLDSKLFQSQQALRRDADNLLAALVRMGVAEAYQLEDKLRLLQ